MSEEPAEQVRSRRQTVSLARLYLDPNNFRFVDNFDYQHIGPEEVFSANVQRRTTNFVLGKSQEHVQDLIASIKENGWLDIDPILVEKRDGGRFLIVEGNRRIATLKHLQRRYEEGAVDLGRLEPALFSKVPVVLHEAADERQHMVMMGLHHISGKRRWPAINRALAMKRLQDQFDGDVDAVCRALGVTKQDFNRSVRTLALVDEYKKSDYGDQFQADKYTLFREILGRPTIRKWLDWDDATRTASNQSNLDSLFRWMSQDVEFEKDGEEDDFGFRPESDPVITTLGHVRELAKMIEDPDAVNRLEETRSLQEATLSSGLLVKAEIDRAFGSCDTGIQRLSRQVGELASEDLDRVEHMIGKLQGLALARKRRPPGSVARLPWEPFNELTKSQFSSISVQNYRGISGLVLDDLSRVNLIAGVNNAGKTSLLEAIYLLTRQNDERALMDVNRWRGRIEGEIDPFWLFQQIQPAIQISGCFDDVPDNSASLEMQRISEPDDDIKDQTTFLARIAIQSSYGGEVQATDVALFGDRPWRTNFDGRHWLCRSAFSSPFWTNRSDALAESNKASLEAGTKGNVIEFIKSHIDTGITNIELADGFNRFLVSHLDFDGGVDLSAFGEGLRRVFEIGSLFAGARGGVLLIDEFETAIHRDLLVPFTRSVQELAAQLNVQVFLTTHSKEALDAFIVNNYKTDDIACYAIRRSEKGASVRRFGGEKLLLLHEAADFDVRGIQ